MMLLDGCFIIELFCRCGRSDCEDARKTDPLFKAAWIGLILSTDLILIENQLPFFVLEKLWDTIGFGLDSLFLISIALKYIPIYSHFPPTQDFDEHQMALESISKLSASIVSPGHPKFKFLDVEKVGDIKHLLDLVRKFMLIEETLEVKQETNFAAKREDTVGIVKYLLDLVLKFRWNREKREVEQATKIDYTPVKRTYSATELSDFGVRFKATKTGKFYDIKFKDGVLQIPIIQMHSTTEVIFRNLIAYEEHAHSRDVKYITDYIAFMDNLIDSPKDVELLRHKGIIDITRDDGVISAMFNRMINNVTISQNFYYMETTHKLTEYCGKRRHKWMASLKRNYLSTPWRILSIIAAFILLTVALLQTVYTILSYYHS